MLKDKLTATDIEIAVARHFSNHLVVPNISWGWQLDYEADLVVLTAANWAWEVEIKTTISDLKADAQKRHCHDSPKFVRLYFAVPDFMAAEAVQYVPARAGILSVGVKKWVNLVKSPRLNPAAIRITDSQRLKLMELGLIRIWSLKRHLQDLKLKLKNKPV